MTQQENLDFETAFARLEVILEKMNAGSLLLEESLRLYEEADRLIQICHQKLSHAESKIEMLIKNRDGSLSVTEEGQPQKEPFRATAPVGTCS